MGCGVTGLHQYNMGLVASRGLEGDGHKVADPAPGHWPCGRLPFKSDGLQARGGRHGFACGRVAAVKVRESFERPVTAIESREGRMAR